MHHPQYILGVKALKSAQVFHFWHNAHHHNDHHPHHHCVYSPGRGEPGSSAAAEAPGSCHTQAAAGEMASGAQGSESAHCFGLHLLLLDWLTCQGVVQTQKNSFQRSIIFGFPPALKCMPCVSLSFLPASSGKSLLINKYEILAISNELASFALKRA